MNDKNTKNSYTLNLIKKYDFVVKKRFGQNFLVDEHVLNKIVNYADITKDDVVIEIGPGLGSLTKPLLEKAKKVVAIEIDNSIIPILNEELSGYDNFELINSDVLKVDFDELLKKYEGRKVKVVANLPYYITTPIIMGFLENNVPIDEIIVMIQKEVAHRMAAKPATKDYGSLTIAVNYYCEPYIVANVPTNCFVPRPTVDSCVIALKVKKQKDFYVEDEKFLFTLIKSGFSMRRKTIFNCLANSTDLSLPKDVIKSALLDSEIDEKARGETLGLSDYVRLAKNILAIINRG